jgi:hypothetical protein
LCARDSWIGEKEGARGSGKGELDGRNRVAELARRSMNNMLRLISIEIDLN